MIGGKEIKIEKRAVLMFTAVFVGAMLLVPTLSPAQIFINLTGSKIAQTDVNNSVLDNQNLGASGSGTVLPVELNSQHYSLIPQALFDSYVQKAYATGTFKHFTLIASEGVTTLPTGDKIGVFSFNGSVPAPTLRVTQGDVVEVTVINPENNEDVHSIDFHGSQLSAVPNFAAVKQGESKTLTFVAVNPGVWAYHCEANNVFELWEHPLKGMAGMMIVDPSSGTGYTGFETNNGVTGAVTHVKPLAREFSLVYGEIYAADDTESLPTSTTPSTGALVDAHDFDQGKMFHEIPTYAVVNGIPFGYIAPLATLDPWNSESLRDVINVDFLPDNPNPPLSALANSSGNSPATHLNVKTGEHVRFFIQNVGDKAVAWHIVGEQLDRVSVGGSIVAKGVQTWEVPAYGDATVDVVFEQAGVYAAVNHDYSMFFKGQAIIIAVSDSGGPNPSNAVPEPVKGSSITQATCSYGIGPDSVVSDDDNQFQSGCGI